MKKNKKAIIIISFVLVIAAALLIGTLVAASRAPKDGIPRNAVILEVQEARTETITVNITSTGKAEFIEKHTVYPSTSAQLAAFSLKVGDAVKEGEIIAVYDNKGYETLEKQLRDAELSLQSAKIGLDNAAMPASDTELLQAENAVKQAEKSKADIDAQIESQDLTLEQYRRSLQTARETYDKNKILYDNQVISKAELDSYADQIIKIEDQIKTAEKNRETTMAGYQTVNDSLALARKQLEALRQKSSDSKVVNQVELQRIQVSQAENSIAKLQDQLNDYVAEELSPVSGTVISVGYAQGETANAAKALAVIADVSPKNLVIKTYIPENEASQIELGQEVKITGSSIGMREYIGYVSRISPTVENALIGTSQEPAVAIEISLAETNADVVIKSGNSLDLDITTNVIENATVIPLMSTILDSDKNNYVYVLKSDYSVEKRIVKLLNYTGLYVQVEGVAVGEYVINNPPSSLKEGDFVRPGSPQTQQTITLPRF